MAVRQYRHRQCGAFFIVATLCILYARCVPDSAPGNADGENVPTCLVASKKIQLELSGSSPLAKFKCDPGLTHLLPKISGGTGTTCFTDASCTGTGTIPEGGKITEAALKDQSKVYTVEITKIPTADVAAYFRCTDTDALVEKAAQECIVEVKIKGSPAISEDRQCTQADQTVNIRLTAPTNEATFVCGGTLTTLAPADSTVFSDESCTKETKLDTLLPGATLTPGTGLEKQRHTLAIPTFPEKTTTLCYKCQDSGANEACKVIITVDSASAASTTTASTSGAASVVAEAGGLAVVSVAALSTTVLYGRYL
ncbi:sag-related sequence srs28 [Cystoisospora suis]|uniref:Sag-related sequence srs28 n=1 Tax=Cystoisospora suis TaxID=483139 RepID=A0A2C6KXV7_9APIC|nr:sag-related sequence srs28 [Cystoisospora suis]